MLNCGNAGLVGGLGALVNESGAIMKGVVNMIENNLFGGDWLDFSFSELHAYEFRVEYDHDFIRNEVANKIHNALQECDSYSFYGDIQMDTSIPKTLILRIKTDTDMTDIPEWLKQTLVAHMNGPFYKGQV